MTSATERLLEGLTPPQREAVLHQEGPLLMLAGPGSGKTRVVTHRIAHLIESGVSPTEIVALTFTNKAAEEMQDRLRMLVGDAPVWLGTFHRFCARLLRRYASLVGLSESFSIYDTSDSARALQATLDALDLDTVHFSVERIAAEISRAKNALVTADRFQARGGRPIDTILAKVYPAYQEYLLNSAAVDFDDLLLHVAELLQTEPELRRQLDARYKYILVDEYQDTNRPQYFIVKGLSVDHPNLAVTGDPDQSIYGWRGADLANILEFERDFATQGVRVVRLEENWRSTKRILRVAETLIAHNRNRKAKDLYTNNEQGQLVRLATYATPRDEADSIAGRISSEIESGRRNAGDFAVFYRVNALSRSVEAALRNAGIAYQMVHGLEFFKRKEIKDCLAYLRLINNPRDDVALLRIINTPPRQIGAKTVQRLQEQAVRQGETLWEAARVCGLNRSIAKRSAARVAEFVALMDGLRTLACEPVDRIFAAVLEETAYREWLSESEVVADQERTANIEELLNATTEFEDQSVGAGGLQAFLEQVALVSDADDWDGQGDKVSLMTLHAAKGLEFPSVFIIGCEEGLLPHERSRDEPAQLEEERRLMFVGITRAQQELQLSLTISRDTRGLRRITVPSSFLMELPRQELEFVDAALPSYQASQEVAVESVPRQVLRPSSTKPASLTTAANLIGETNEEQRSSEAALAKADDFHPGMAVVHPEYQLGKVIAVTGRGKRRTATVAFATAGEKKFVIAQSSLRPARRPE